MQLTILSIAVSYIMQKIKACKHCVIQQVSKKDYHVTIVVTIVGRQVYRKYS